MALRLPIVLLMVLVVGCAADDAKRRLCANAPDAPICRGAWGK